MKAMRQGNTLTEYGFVGAILLLGIMATLAMLGGNLDGVLQGLKGDMLNSRDAALLGAEARANDGRIGLDPSKLKYETVCLGPGQCIQVPVIPESPYTVTAGSNGGELTKEFAKVLDQIVAALEADPDTDPDMLAKVKELAAKGHELGDIQEDIAGKEYRDEFKRKKRFLRKSKQVKTADGKDKLKQDLSNLKNGPAQEFKRMKSEVESLLKSNDIELPEPAKKLIEQESDQIVAIVDGIDPETVELEGEKPKLESTGELTHQSSEKICGTATTDSCRG